MKIADIRAWALSSDLAEPFAFSQGWVRRRAATIVEVVTDEGLSGWGEALCQGLQPPEIAAATVRSALRPMLIGADASRPEVLWHRMYNQSRDYGLKGAVIGAIGAVDIALWDLLGKSLGRPVHALLGGAFRERVQAYATGFYRVRGRGEGRRLAEEAQRHLAAGFRAMKVKLGFGVDDDLAVMREVRAALAGEPVTLMIDTNHAYGVADAIRLGRALEDCALRWYEEPVAQEDLAGYREVRNAVGCPIAGGENEFTLFGFRELIGARAVDVVQPDIAAAGGFTACRHIAALAHAHGVAVNPHVWGSAIGQAASLHLIAALPVAHPSLFADEPILEYDQSSHPFRRELVARPLAHESGWVAIPNEPGLGIEVNREVLAKYAVPA
ncbi:MAG: mandelate racemase/muconate lactonizing enzyme family protein [Betaproteobacteria bacterium]|nr:mandelate racemase/muconate lactonizing enzyme family protein [Betaproteobacteria bacterium]